MGFWSKLGEVFMEGFNEGMRDYEAPEKVEDFDGTDKMYAAKQNRYLYEDRDWLKAMQFDMFVAEKYPGREFVNENGMIMHSIVLYHGYQTQQLGVIQYLRVLAAEQENNGNDLNWWVESAAEMVMMGNFVEVFGLSHYNFCQFIYEYLNDARELDRLYEKYENADDNGALKIERKMNKLSNKYNGWLGYPNFYVKTLIDASDVDHIVNNIQSSAVKYCSFMDEVYTHVLNNAIRIHNAQYLRNLYPTEAQKNAVRSQIQQEIINKMQQGLGNLNAYNKYANECLQICSRMFELEDQNSDYNIMAKGALSLALGFISGPMGIASGLREGYNIYNRENDLERLGEMLDNSLRNLCDEYTMLGGNLLNVSSQLGHSLEEKICRTYLHMAISDIFNKIQQNGDQLYDVREYFR